MRDESLITFKNVQLPTRLTEDNKNIFIETLCSFEDNLPEDYALIPYYNMWGKYENISPCSWDDIITECLTHDAVNVSVKQLDINFTSDFNNSIKQSADFVVAICYLID